jgi:hypothetical protein
MPIFVLLLPGRIVVAVRGYSGVFVYSVGVGGVRACVVCIVVCYMHVYAYFWIPRFPVFPGSLPRFPTAWGRRVGVGGVGGGGSGGNKGTCRPGNWET